MIFRRVKKVHDASPTETFSEMEKRTLRIGAAREARLEARWVLVVHFVWYKVRPPFVQVGKFGKMVFFFVGLNGIS